MTQPLPWFRFHIATVYDRAAQELPADLFKGWVNLLCVAGHHDGVLPEIADVAFALRITEAQAAGLIEQLTARGLLVEVGGKLMPHDWSTRRYASDSSAQRMRRLRERRDVTDDVTETSPLPSRDGIEERRRDKSRNASQVVDNW